MKELVPYMSLLYDFRVEEVGLLISNYTYKNVDFCEYMKFVAISLKFDICLLIKSSNLKILLYICDKYKFNNPPHTKFRFYLIDFLLNTYFPSNVAFFFVYR